VCVLVYIPDIYNLLTLNVKIHMSSTHPNTRSLSNRYINDHEDDPSAYANAVAQRLKCTRLPLLHALLAMVPCSEVITSKVDRLYEECCASMGISVCNLSIRKCGRWCVCMVCT